MNWTEYKARRRRQDVRAMAAAITAVVLLVGLGVLVGSL